MVLICPIAGDGDSDHLVKVILANFLNCEVTGFPLVIHKYLTESYFEIT